MTQSIITDAKAALKAYNTCLTVRERELNLARAVSGLLQKVEEQDDMLKGVVDAIIKTLKNNGHLADGDNCTLIDLKQVLIEQGIDNEQG